MATQNPARLIIELSPYSVQFAATGAAGLTAHGECACDPAAVAAKLAEVAPGGVPAGSLVLWTPKSALALMAGSEEAASARTAKTLLAKAAAAPGAPATPFVAAMDATTGLPVDPVGSSPWLMNIVSSEALDEAKAQLAALGLPVPAVRLALPPHVGAVVTALQDMPESTRVLVWQPGESDARLLCVSESGCEAAGPAGVGFTQIFEAVQAGLGLKFRAAASKLFFNAGYDFSETAGPIAERIAAALRPSIEALGTKPTALHVVGLPSAQSWLAKAVASALDIAPLAPDMAAFCTQCGLQGPAVKAELPAAAMGLLLQAGSEGTGGASAWRTDWLDANAPAPAPAPAPAAPAAPKAAAPAPAAPIPAPAAAPKPAPTPAPEPVAAAPKVPVSGVFKPAPAKPAPAKPAPEPQPAAVAPVAQTKPAEPAPAAKPAAKPVEKLAPAPVILAEPAPAEIPAPAAPAVEAAPVAKKKPVALLAAVGALVVLGGAAAFFLKGNSAKVAEAAPAAAQPSAEDQRMREEENARMLAEELKTPRSFRNDRYSFEVSDRGFLRKLVGVGNRTIVDEFGWLELQGMFTGSTRTFYAGTISDNDFRPSINKTVRDGKVVFEINGIHPRFTMETVVTCLPSTLRIETVFKPVNMEDPRGPISGVYMVKMNRQSLSLGQRATVEPGMVGYSTQSGPFTLKFNGDAWGQSGEAGKQTVTVGSNLVFFYFAGGTDPKDNVLRTEISLP